MPKATSKGDVSGSESEPERTRSAKKSASASSKIASKDKGRVDEDDSAPEPAASDDEDGSDEEEYEIEAILDAKHGTFPEGRIGYLVKWKGYGDEHNSWVDEKDAEGAKVLITEFWKRNKKGGRKPEPVKPKPAAKTRKSPVKDADSDVEDPPAKKRGRPSKAATAPSDDEAESLPVKQKKPRKSTGTAAAKGPRRKSNADAMDEDVEAPTKFTDMHKLKEAGTWEHLIQSIDTVERTESGELYVYFTLKNGKGHGRENSDLCKKKMPYKLIEFYESNLRWKATDEDDVMEE
ncbi:uncharacterized protein TRAVEDRAFT_58457 [Trametes versicolor FP-101664 SS1]|uniref:uncharacterized protein n=1 Tax=Trametes versicolor (strain FP-101664) TaxID=717944 RepID=UPI0004623782|nr:uncharacterized protein TRAVEDRAFT_58457 [Trametes versicolor FP-101664 SS1]EIW59799.1 hypothetical protein TRAVEDRAFT_58457 [Trametes versicolor FP-101664 SS1]